jgi:AcrR family transcriptional regulator
MTVKGGVSGRAAQSIFATPPPLPHGPHLLTREQVADSQRTRLMAALTELMAEHGYAAVRLAELVTRAGVSKATFYEHFADKEQCMLAAYDEYLRTLIAAIVPAAQEDTPLLKDFVRSVVTRYLTVIERDLTAARAFFVELESAGPEARTRLRVERQAFIALVAGGHQHSRARDPSLAPLPTIAYEAIVDAAREIVRDRLDTEPEPNLKALIPDLTLTFTAIFQGAAAAAHDTQLRPASEPVQQPARFEPSSASRRFSRDSPEGRPRP